MAVKSEIAAEPLNLSRHLNDIGVRAFVQTGAPIKSGTELDFAGAVA